MDQCTAYPETPSARTKWIKQLRAPVNRPNSNSEPRILLEEEICAQGKGLRTGTIFLINRECPWTCVMCDLWKHTSNTPLPPGHAATQLRNALAKLETNADCPIEQIKIYNSGSFFDSRAIYPSDYPSVAESLSSYSRVIVENHPKLTSQPVKTFNDILDSSLEIAMGLESADDKLLDKLNKRFSLTDYKRACDFLGSNDIAHRAFIMVQPPFTHPDDALELCIKTVEFAFDQNASCVSLIPSRATTGAMHSLQRTGDFVQPSLAMLEQCFSKALELNRGRIFVDLWDLEMFSHCNTCFNVRRNRLNEMNNLQRVLPISNCKKCQT